MGLFQVSGRILRKALADKIHLPDLLRKTCAKGARTCVRVRVAGGPRCSDRSGQRGRSGRAAALPYVGSDALRRYEVSDYSPRCRQSRLEGVRRDRGGTWAFCFTGPWVAPLARLRNRRSSAVASSACRLCGGHCLGLPVEPFDVLPEETGSEFPVLGLHGVEHPVVLRPQR